MTIERSRSFGGRLPPDARVRAKLNGNTIRRGGLRERVQSGGAPGGGA